MSDLLHHQGNRALQDAFGSRAIADRLSQVTLRTAFSGCDRAFIAASGFFFLATAEAHGRPDCSFKGGSPGFVCVTGPAEPASSSQNRAGNRAAPVAV